MTQTLRDPKFAENQQRFGASHLRLFAGYWAAWLPDGTRVRIVAETEEHLLERLAIHNIAPDEVVIERIPGERLPPGPWPDIPIDFGMHAVNRNRVTAEYLVPFLGKHVAWHADGTHIVAAAETGEELYHLLRERGIAGGTVVVGYVDDPNIGWM